LVFNIYCMAAPDIKKSPYKIFIYYVLISLLFFGLINCIGLITSLSVQTRFLFILLAYLVTGIIHIFSIKAVFTGLKPQITLLFTIILTFLGCIAVLILNYFVFRKASQAMFTAGLVLFPLPFLFLYTLELFLSIPDRIFKKWYYPLDHAMPNLDLLDLTRVLIIQFEFLKATSETSLTNFKAKAPSNMPFGELFYIFISDYNESHPQNSIEITNSYQQPYPWIFHIKTPWWKRNKFIDPDLTFQENGIVNNDIISCQRIDQ
jgi:hypothetical protein